MQEYPLDIRGVALRYLQPATEYRWVAPFQWRGKLDLDSYNLETTRRRKLEQILRLDGAIRGARLPRAAGTAARQGRVSLAHVILEAHLNNSRITPELEARARSLLNDQGKRINAVMNRFREWPQGVWNLQDTQAWVIPAFIHAFRAKINREQITVISGGHLLAPGEWAWQIPANSCGWNRVDPKISVPNFDESE
ncbi:MAG TPA: hypothetical protein EYQ73_00255 [Candidatus Poseidoniales archaeon]|jgi:hypothetical protein|nr:hypothetical protein [Candidatus Poseidoniales archaeon]HIL65158.1 hypothetical protein [Candidatus Poseidoniales archaeon]